MGLLRKLVWTAGCVALGAALATVEIDGKTGLRHLGAAVTGPVWQGLKASVESALDRARGLIAQGKPVERHSPEDRDALNKLIAKRAQP